MKNQLNCPNCGAPIVSEKCQYCGTLFYDFSAIDLGKPCYLKIKYNNAIMAVKAIPTNVTCTMNTDCVDVCRYGEPISSIITGHNLDLSMDFHCIPFDGVIDSKNSKVCLMEVRTL